MTPAEAVARADSGEFLMLPPTVTTLRELLPFGSPMQALAASSARRVEPILARAVIGDGGRLSVSWPGHPELTMSTQEAPPQEALTSVDAAGDGPGASR